MRGATLRSGFGVVAAMVMACGAAVAQPGPFVLTRVGLYGPGYTNASGRHESTANFMNAAGTVAGTSNRFTDAGLARGQAVWLGRNGVTTRVGFFDAAHTSGDGTQLSSFVGLTPSGLAAGNSSRYQGANITSTAWITDGVTTTTLGLTDALHTGPSGIQDSGVRAINASGDTAGFSRQLSSGVAGWSGTTAWARRGGVTQQIGLTDAEHTRTDGLRSGFTSAMSASGVVAGISRRYAALLDRGTSAWVDDGVQSRRIGLVGAQYTSPTGMQTQNIRAISAAGMVIGDTTAYYPNQTGNHAWLASPSGDVTRIGLTDAEHTSPVGPQYSETIAINASGWVIGRSTRYNPTTGNNGESAWVHANGVTRRLGFTDSDHTVPVSGSQFSRAIAIGASGAVLGESTRASPLFNGGRSIWVDANEQTRRVGLFDALHTNQNGFQDSQGLAINGVGDAIGVSSRYTGPFISNTGWFYDSVTLTTVPLVFSTSANNEAFTTPALVLDNRTVLGTYLDYATLTTRVFWWTRTDGVFDVTAFVPGGIQASGWQSLRSVFSAAVPGSFDGTTIVGIGNATGVLGNSVYVLTPVPAPGVMGLGVVGMAVMGLRRRR